MVDNRLSFMNDLNFDWLPMIRDGLLRKNLKRHFKMATHQVEVFPLGGAQANSSKSSFLLQTCNPDWLFKTPAKVLSQLNLDKLDKCIYEDKSDIYLIVIYRFLQSCMIL